MATAPAGSVLRTRRFEVMLLAIALAALVFRVGYIAATRHSTEPCGREVCGDALYYSAQGHAIGLGHWYTDLFDERVQTADHPPLTALVLAPVSYITQGNAAPITAQRLTIALVGFLAVIAIGFLGRRVGGARGQPVGLIAAALAAINANLWMNDVILMSEAPAALLIAVSLLAVYRFIEAPTWRRAASVGALVGLAGLTRAEQLLLLPITFVPVALWTRSLPVPARIGRIAIAGGAGLLVLAPWTALNLTRFNQPVLLSTNDGITLLGANCDDVYGIPDDGGIGFWQLRCIDPLQPQIPPDADQSDVSAIYRKAGLEYIGNHKRLIPKVEVIRLGRGWGVFRPDQMVWLNQGEGRMAWASWTGFVQWWLLVPAAIAGGVILRRRRLPVWPLASTAVIVTVTILAFYGIVRFRLPADIAAVVLAAVAIDALWARVARRSGNAEADEAEVGNDGDDGDGDGDGDGQANPDGNARAGDGRAEVGRPGNDEDDGYGAAAASFDHTTAGVDDRTPDEADPAGTPASSDPPFGAEVSTPVPELSGGAHFPCLDAYRGIGMTMVLLNHAAYATGWMNRDTAAAHALGPLVARLDLSVPMFFVMSGFLLYRPFAKSTLQAREPLPLRTFYRRRGLRIFPAYWVALAGIALVFGLPIVGGAAWIGNIFLLPAFGVPVEACNDADVCHAGYGITQAWSIGVELTFYLLLPLFAALMVRVVGWVLRTVHGEGPRVPGSPPSPPRPEGSYAHGSLRQRALVLLGGLAVLYLAGTAFRLYVVTVDPSWGEQSLLWLPMFLDLFAIGMALAVISAAAQLGEVIPRALRWCGDHPALCWTAAGAIFLAVTRMKYPSRPFGLHDADGSSDYLPRQFLYGIASAIWLAPAIFGHQTVGLLRRVLASRPLVYLGGISLSFYLWHLVIIDQVKAWTIPDYARLEELAANPPPGNTLAAVATFTGNYLQIVVIAWGLSFIVASALFWLVEYPFLRLKDEPLRALLRRVPRAQGASSERPINTPERPDPG